MLCPGIRNWAIFFGNSFIFTINVKQNLGGGVMVSIGVWVAIGIAVAAGAGLIGKQQKKK